jgi:Histidine kinase-like ATPase domain
VAGHLQCAWHGEQVRGGSEPFLALMAHTLQIEGNSQKDPAILPPRRSHCRPHVELDESLPSTIAAIFPAVDQAMRFIRIFIGVDGNEVDVKIALREAIANAVVHGNHQDPNKRVDVVCRCSADGEISITVRD